MSDNVDNLILEHLKRFQATLDSVENRLGDLTNRMANVEGSLVSVVQQIGHFAAVGATQQLAIDHINARLDRIERRLELTH